jgi:succinate-semialdehyde dehydrogenase / glutarate-semialdehyde dehydrogenase
LSVRTLSSGVLNLVFGEPAKISEYLIPHASIRLGTFTGSIPVGKHLAAMAGQYMKPCIMELGGRAPVIVCDDADPVVTATASVTGKTRNAGQMCVSPTRWYVQERIYEQFTRAFAEKAAAVKIGNGLDPDNQMGPLANARRIDMMETLVADAKSKSAKVLAGGGRIGNRGYHYPVALLADLPDDARERSCARSAGSSALTCRVDISAVTAQAWRFPFSSRSSSCAAADVALQRPLHHALRLLEYRH